MIREVAPMDGVMAAEERDVRPATAMNEDPTVQYCDNDTLHDGAYANG